MDKKIYQFDHAGNAFQVEAEKLERGALVRLPPDFGSELVEVVEVIHSGKPHLNVARMAGVQGRRELHDATWISRMSFASFFAE